MLKLNLDKMKKRKLTTDDIYKTFLVFGGCMALYMTCFIFVDLGWWNLILPMILATITTAKILDNDKKEKEEEKNNKSSSTEKTKQTKKKRI